MLLIAMKIFRITLILTFLISSCTGHVRYDVLIRNGNILDGSGTPAYSGDVGIISYTITAIGNLNNARGIIEIDATGMIHVFVNSLQVIRDGEHTVATPGRVICGPGYQQK